MTRSWLDDIVIVNEGPSGGVAGDIAIYRSEGDACTALEPWWVRDGEGQAFTAAGTRLILDVDASDRVIVSCREPCDEGAEIVLAWLQSLAHRTLEWRVEAAGKGRAILSPAEEQGILPGTVEGLVAYIGFRWVSSNDWFATGCLLLMLVITGLLVAILVKLN